MDESRATIAILSACVLSIVGAGCGVEPTQVTGPIAQAEAGQWFMLGERRVEVVEMAVVPWVTNDFSRRYVFDAADNPKLVQLRQREQLDAAVADGTDEFDRQVRLLAWTYERFAKFGKPTSDAFGALEIVEAIDAGHTFFCAHYARLLVSAAAAMGWVDRPLALRTAKPTTGAPEHTVTEIWSNQYAKWVMFDPTYALYCEAAGVPLSAWEIRQRWLYDDGEGLTFVIGAERTRYTLDDLPIVRAHHAGFGDLALTTRTLDKFAFIGYIPNTNLMDALYDYSGMFIVKDALCDGVSWHIRDNPTDPGTEPYFPIQQAGVELEPTDEGLAVDVRTFGPNFDHFEYRLDSGPWTSGAPDLWPLHDGRNSLEALCVNRFGVRGAVSSIVLNVEQPDRKQ